MREIWLTKSAVPDPGVILEKRQGKQTGRLSLDPTKYFTDREFLKK